MLLSVYNCLALHILLYTYVSLNIKMHHVLFACLSVYGRVNKRKLESSKDTDRYVEEGIEASI